VILINEDGKGLRLPRNPIADAAWSLFDTYGCLASGDFLVGPVLFVGARRSGEMTDLAEETRDGILTFLAEACGLDWRES